MTVHTAFIEEYHQTKAGFDAELTAILNAAFVRAERELCYQWALRLVERIDEDLTCGVEYWSRGGGLLTELDQVVNAILDKDLAGME